MQEPYLRKVEYSDIQILYEWVNDAETRANSFNSDSISFDVHKQWFEEKLKSDKVLFFMCQTDDKPIGQIRLEILSDTAIIHYSINPVFRGQGFGQKMLILAEKKIVSEYSAIKHLLAEVKSENISSQHIFNKLNYVELTGDSLVRFIKNIIPPPCLKYRFYVNRWPDKISCLCRERLAA
jgi:spore coat polysaccharide biosynthesis protein SpsF